MFNKAKNICINFIIGFLVSGVPVSFVYGLVILISGTPPSQILKHVALVTWFLMAFFIGIGMPYDNKRGVNLK